MAIEPLNSEQQNTLNEARLNLFSNTGLIQKLLNPEIRALIEQTINQPLLLEKLLLQKNNEALVTLKFSQTDINSNSLKKSPLAILGKLIQLKLPAQIAFKSQILPQTQVQSQFISQAQSQPISQAQSTPQSNSQHLPVELETVIKLLNSSNKVTLSLNHLQQVVIEIVASSNSKTSQSDSILKLTFVKSELNATGGLVLSQPKVTSDNLQLPSLSPQTNLVQTVDLNKHIGQIATSLISAPTQKSNNIASNFTQLEVTNSQLKEKISSLLNSSNAIRTFIKHVENIGIQKELTLDVKAIELIKGTVDNFRLNTNKINNQIKHLFHTINKPLALENLTQMNTTENTKNLVSRLIKSGNLFENALKQRIVNNNSNPLNQSSKIPSDNKLLLNQIISQLDKLLVEINRYSEKPVTASQIERIEKSLFTHVKEFTPLEKHQLETSKNNAVQKIQIQQEQIQTLNNLVKSLLGNIKNSLHQIEQNQLHSLKSEQFNLQQFLVDLPIKQNGLIDSFEMRFESQQKNNQSVKNKYWKVVVRFDLEPLGPMFAEIQFENEKLSTQLFAENKETASLINLHLPTLRKSLFNAGVEVENVSASQGNIPKNLCGQDKPSIDTHA